MKRLVGIVAGIGMLAVAGVPQGATAQERAALVWGPCEKEGKPASPGNSPAPAESAGSREECATLRVPLDYSNPDQTIGIALNRIKGKTSRDHLGALLVNPGGPGASGRSLAKTRGRGPSRPTWPTGSM